MDLANKIASVDAIISKYKNHPSINQIKKAEFQKASESQKGDRTRYNTALKTIKLSGDIIDKHLTNIINTDLDCSCFSENAKTASVKPIYKRENRSDKNNYCVDQLAF